MIIIRYLLNIYRFFLYLIFSRCRKQVMPESKLCNVITNDPTFEKYRGDIVHPCVRYTKNEFRGHQWWMVYTPYYNANALLENPILCYGDSNNNDAPIHWQVETLIRDTPAIGYNSDPTIFFSNNGLNIFWRENNTERTQADGVHRATYGLLLTQETQLNIENPVLKEKDIYYDKEVSPTIIKHKEKYLAYAADVRFKNKRIHFKNALLDKITSSIAKGLSVFDLYNEQKSYGIAIYESLSYQFEFHYKKTVKISNCNKLYRPWHFDFFEYDNKLFAVIQSNQFNADICLAVSSDYENFRMFKKPLITQHSINKVGLYKPTGIVRNNIFHLYYTAQDIENRGLNKLYYTNMPVEKLLKILEN